MHAETTRGKRLGADKCPHGAAFVMMRLSNDIYLCQMHAAQWRDWGALLRLMR